MAEFTFTNDGLIDVAFEQMPQHIAYPSRASWPLPVEETQLAQTSRGEQRTASAPLQATTQPFQPHNPSPTLLTEWSLQPSASQLSYEASSLGSQISGPFTTPFQTSPVDFIASSQGPMDPNMNPYVPMNGQTDSLQWTWQDLQTNLMEYPNNEQLTYSGTMSQRSLSDSSPTSTYLEVRSLPSSSSDNGWATVDYQSFDGFNDQSNSAVFNPGQTLHIRTSSNSSESHSDCTHQSRNSFGSYEEIPNALTSPESEMHYEITGPTHQYQYVGVSPSALVEPLQIGSSSPPTRSPASTNASSPPGRKPGRKSPIAKSTKPVIRRSPQANGKDNEKKVGRRRGPLRPDQRKQASEIRKLRACLRCKFLKKTCDKGEPCGGCQPSHARLWQVPCTRIDIKDIAYFMKDWKSDFERHVTLGFSVANIKSYSEVEQCLLITHGYGYSLPVNVREVYVRDESCFGMDWVESMHETPLDFEVGTARLTAGKDGIPRSLLDAYIDRHLDGDFVGWVKEYFDGTPFLTELLTTAYKYYLQEPLPVIRKALKLVIAYNLTMHVTMVEGLPEEDEMEGKVDEEDSKFHGRTLAPVMINFQIKCDLAEMWRALQKEVLEELSSLFSSVYSGDKLKNWPTIFIVAAILLSVWEEMQFDCHYRNLDVGAVKKFCDEMENTPVGVIVGLFQAISQKIPAFNEWDSEKHHHFLGSKQPICDTLTEIREHVVKYEKYLKSRNECRFDRKDFDCLSNKFLAKLVIRAN